MKTLLAIISLSVIISVHTPVLGQGRGGGMGGGQSPEAMARNQTEMMTKRLGLTKDQIPAVQKINLDAAKKMIAFRNAHRGNRTAMQNKMRELQKEKEPALKVILTNEQWDKLLELHSEQPGGQGPGYGRN